MTTLTSKLIIGLIDQLTGPARGINGALAGMRRQVTAFNQSQAAGSAMATGFARRLLAMGAGYIGVDQGIRRTVGASIKFEEAFADVRKVVDASDEQMANIRRQILGLSRELPTSAEGIAAIYAAAGQSNVPLQELGRFSEMVAKVAVAWDTTEGETSESLAKIKTQLHMTVDQVGLVADAINHLSNNAAAKAPDLVDYMKRVAATGEMFGFQATETLAFGGAMVAAGAQTEVASTSFRNMGRSLTMGARATKQQRVAFKALGLDAVKTAKSMQKNALGTTLDVLDKIQKLPEWQRISIASALFGDEARALMPVINNSTELRRQLGLVGDQANYAGSAFKEYMVRADTAANALAIIGNKMKDTLRSIGDEMLPTIKQAGLGVGDVLDTLGERATILDRLTAATQGFLKGLGYDGGVRETVNAIGDLLFGKADGSGAADQLGRLFEQFRQGGAAIRAFWDANKDSPVAKFLSEVSGYGFSLAMASVGIGVIAAAITRLANALLFLSGAKAALGVLRALYKGSKWVMGTGGATAAATAATGEGLAAGGVAATLGRWMHGLKAAGFMASWSSLVQGMADTPGDTFAQQVANQRKAREGLERALGQDGAQPFNWRKFFLGAAAEPGFSLREHMKMNLDYGSRSPATDVSTALSETVIQTRPTGVQDVNVRNVVRPNQVFNISISGVAGDLKSIANAVVGAIGSLNREMVESGYGSSDGGL